MYDAGNRLCTSSCVSVRHWIRWGSRYSLYWSSCSTTLSCIEIFNLLDVPSCQSAKSKIQNRCILGCYILSVLQLLIVFILHVIVDLITSTYRFRKHCKWWFVVWHEWGFWCLVIILLIDIMLTWQGELGCQAFYLRKWWISVSV